MKISHKPILFLAGFLFCGAGQIYAEPISSYVGIQVPPLPPDHVDMGSFLVNPEAPVEYTLVDVWRGERKMWWLKKRVPSGKEQAGPSFKVVAVMAVPEIPQGYYFVKGDCKKNGKSAPEIIAAAKYEKEKKEFTQIHGTWYVDIAKETIAPYPVTGITCLNENNS
jgi:hypothetical protein